MTDQSDRSELLGMTADIVSAYVSNNSVAPADMPALIASIHTALKSTDTPAEEPQDEVERPTAAQIRKSVTPDYIISFEDGRQFKSMKRALSLAGMTPAQYREKWGLPSDYPMVAPAYAAARSALAKSMGLGATGRAAKGQPMTKAAPKATAARGRPKKA